MMTEESETAAVEPSRSEQLREPLLLLPAQKNEPSQRDISQRRGGSTIEDPTVEPLEVVEGPEESEGIGVVQLRYVWILFQCVWPAILLAFEVWIDDGYSEFFVMVVVPSAVLFLLMVFWGANNIYKFHFRDIIPTALWMVLLFADRYFEFFLAVIGLIAVLPVAISCFKHGALETTKSGCECFYYNAIVRPSNRITFYKKLEEDFFEQQHEQEAAEQEQLEAQYEVLSHLEELAQGRSRKPSIWLLAAFAALGILALISLFYVMFVLLSDATISATTVVSK